MKKKVRKVGHNIPYMNHLQHQNDYDHPIDYRPHHMLNMQVNRETKINREEYKYIYNQKILVKNPTWIVIVITASRCIIHVLVCN